MKAIRALMAAKRSARHERTRAIDQARALMVTGLDELRARFARHAPAQLVPGLAAPRPRPGDVPGYATPTFQEAAIFYPNFYPRGNAAESRCYIS